MPWKEHSSKKLNKLSSSERFYDAVTVWIKKPHVVNRRLYGADLLWSDILYSDVLIDDLVKSLRSNGISKACINSVKDVFLCSLAEYGFWASDATSAVAGAQRKSGIGWNVTLRCLVPKQNTRYAKTYDVVVLDRSGGSVYFIPIGEIAQHDTAQILHSKDIIYMLHLNSTDSSISIKVWHEDHISLSTEVVCPLGTVTWLSEVLLAKLARWSEEPELNTDVLSLRHINIQQYSCVYERLKEQYGRYFVQNWNESTDPQKFVYEDIGIAAYLLITWEEERRTKGLTKKQSFVDLGCGNGLLVYILTSEGHPGLGIDIRRRKIWDVLGTVANLQESTVVPSETTTFTDYDWLIGNHSDELTPWIPFIASRSYYSCRYFVLPCCAWDFTCKFADKTAGASQYRVYLDYIRHVGQVCGFKVLEDVLRIPSTKRVCFVGMERTYPPEGEQQMESERLSYLRTRCSLANGSECKSVVDDNTSCEEQQQKHSAASAGGFQPRLSVEKPRNAVCIDRSVKELITSSVLDCILTAAVNQVSTVDGRKWNKGGSVQMNEVSSLFDKDVLANLKNECGGLQTVLRNCPDVFCVRNNLVTLRDWTSEEYAAFRNSRQKKGGKRIKLNQTVKTVLCFYHCQHPDGCPLTAEQCRFAHGINNLRSRTEFNEPAVLNIKS